MTLIILLDGSKWPVRMPTNILVGEAEGVLWIEWIPQDGVKPRRVKAEDVKMIYNN